MPKPIPKLPTTLESWIELQNSLTKLLETLDLDEHESDKIARFFKALLKEKLKQKAKDKR